MTDITGATNLEMLLASSTTTTHSLNEAAKRHPSWPWVTALFTLLALAASPAFLLIAVPAVLIAMWWDKVRGTVVAFYEVEGRPHALYTQLVEQFSWAVNAGGRWLEVSRGDVLNTYQYKVNAGASSVVQRESARASLTGPRHMASNIAIPSLESNRRSLYFFPDIAVVKEGRTYVRIPYSDLESRYEVFRFIESGAVPRDTTVVGTTWRFTNVNGGPDRRFNNNHQLSVVLYSRLLLTGRNGLYTSLAFSNPQASQHLASSITAMNAGPDRVG